MKEWEDLSDWYDKKQGEDGDLWHRALIDPVLLRLIGDPRVKDILELGSGNGYLSRRLARRGGRIKAVDSSPRMIENARSHDHGDSLKIAYVHSDSNGLEPNSGWLVERVMFETRVYRRIRTYREPFAEQIPWRLQSVEKRYTPSFHRTLYWYARALHASGLAITALEEPEPTEEFLEKDSDGPELREVPLHLVFKSVKL